MGSSGLEGPLGFLSGGPPFLSFFVSIPEDPLSFFPLLYATTAPFPLWNVDKLFDSSQRRKQIFRSFNLSKVESFLMEIVKIYRVNERGTHISIYSLISSLLEPRQSFYRKEK